MMDYRKAQEEIKETLPKLVALGEFKMPAFGDGTFRVQPNPMAHCISDIITYVVQVKRDGQWLDFSRDESHKIISLAR